MRLTHIQIKIIYHQTRSAEGGKDIFGGGTDLLTFVFGNGYGCD